MERKIKNLEEHVSFLYEELETKEKEIDDLKRDLGDANDLCRQKSISKKKDQEDILELTKLVEEQKIKISCLRKHRNEILDRHEKTIDDYEFEFKAKEGDIKALQDNSELLKLKVADQKEEIEAKETELGEMQKELEKVTLKNFTNSLSEELKAVNQNIEVNDLKKENVELKLKVKASKIFQCEKCDEAFATLEDLRKHKGHSHEQMLNERKNIADKMNDLEKNMLYPKIGLTLSLYDLKKTESILIQKCRCRVKLGSFCRINHTKYSFVKAKSDQFHSTFKSLSNKVTKCQESRVRVMDAVKSDTASNGALMKYLCDQCDNEFSKQGQLKKHMKLEHKPRKNKPEDEEKGTKSEDLKDRETQAVESKVCENLKTSKTAKARLKKTKNEITKVSAEKYIRVEDSSEEIEHESDSELSDVQSSKDDLCSKYSETESSEAESGEIGSDSSSVI